jgi:hypothetical protein
VLENEGVKEVQDVGEVTFMVDISERGYKGSLGNRLESRIYGVGNSKRVENRDVILDW